MNDKHYHPCSDCGAKTPCRGKILQDYGAEPEYFCDSLAEIDFHDRLFICEGCKFRRDDADAAAAMPEASR